MKRESEKAICRHEGIFEASVERLETLVSLLEHALPSATEQSESPYDKLIVSPGGGFLSWDKLQDLEPQLFRSWIFAATFSCLEFQLIRLSIELNELESPQDLFEKERATIFRVYHFLTKSLELVIDNVAWEKVKCLGRLRNSIVHANGFVTREGERKTLLCQLKKWNWPHIKISSDEGYIHLESGFTSFAIKQSHAFFTSLRDKNTHIR